MGASRGPSSSCLKCRHWRLLTSRLVSKCCESALPVCAGAKPASAFICCQTGILSRLWLRGGHHPQQQTVQSANGKPPTRTSHPTVPPAGATHGAAQGGGKGLGRCSLQRPGPGVAGLQRPSTWVGHGSLSASRAVWPGPAHCRRLGGFGGVGSSFCSGHPQAFQLPRAGPLNFGRFKTGALWLPEFPSQG